MKVAVISDIHGNRDALNAVLADIKSQNCEKLFCLGDYVMAGPEPVETLNFLIQMKSQYDIKMIQGNTDLMIANYNELSYENLKITAPVMAEALKDDRKLLTGKQIDFLRALPQQIEIEIEGMKILLVHGSPRVNNENILPDTPLNEVEEMLQDVNADVILCGHTHIPCGFQTAKKQTVINVGSVGRPFTEKPNSCYLVLTVSEGRCLFEHRFVDYDRKSASQKLLKRNFDGKEKLAKTLIEPKERHF